MQFNPPIYIIQPRYTGKGLVKCNFKILNNWRSTFESFRSIPRTTTTIPYSPYGMYATYTTRDKTALHDYNADVWPQPVKFTIHWHLCSHFANVRVVCIYNLFPVLYNCQWNNDLRLLADGRLFPFLLYYSILTAPYEIISFLLFLGCRGRGLVCFDYITDKEQLILLVFCLNSAF